MHSSKRLSSWVKTLKKTSCFYLLQGKFGITMCFMPIKLCVKLCSNKSLSLWLRFVSAEAQIQTGLNFELKISCIRDVAKSIQYLKLQHLYKGQSVSITHSYWYIHVPRSRKLIIFKHFACAFVLFHSPDAFIQMGLQLAYFKVCLCQI